TGQTRLPPNSASYGITCDLVKHDCGNGTGCNPPGNICGAVVGFNASQNCCDGKKSVCKPDSNGIARCFGGCPNDNCTATCPAGYDSTNPLCCIEPAHVCQFSDQCCNGQACAPDPTDGMILKCGGGASACAPFGASCTGTSDTSCCSGLGCTKYGESGFFACLPGTGTTPVTTCKLTGGSCAAGTDCCSGTCTSGKCADWTGGSGSSTSCQAPGGTCTGDADCCAGSACGIPDGATHGTCQAAAAVCAATSQSCSTGVPCCSATDTCTNGACTPRAGCGSAYQACSAAASCCTGYSCIDVATSVACAGGTCLCAPQASQ
ncbi:MAG TPA: hypothetical protein VEM76_04860, partial [Anaeromyxobacteraceae bacterium]|nr:hypothetical protein [Anaeromyxobacteraceae bacterium]